MSAAVAPGTPAPAPVSAPEAPPAPEVQPTVESVEGEGDGEDEVSSARRKAREILFSDKPDAEIEAEVDTEKPKPQPKEEPKPKDESKDEIALSKKWAKVTAQEDRLVKRQKEHLAEAEAKTKALEAREAKLAEREAKHEDPVKYLAEAGWTKDQIVQWMMNDGKADPEFLVKQLETRHQKQIEELRAERERERLEFQEEQESRHRQKELERVSGELATEIKHMVNNDAEMASVRALVGKNPQKFGPFIQNRVEQVIRTVWNKKQEAVDPREALLYVQQELVELQLSNPGQAPAVKPATPVAVEPSPITNGSQSQRTVRPTVVDESDVEALRAKANRILAGEEEPED